MGADMFYDNPGKQLDQKLLKLAHDMRADLVQENKELRGVIRTLQNLEIDCGHEDTCIITTIGSHTIRICSSCAQMLARGLHHHYDG
jgi:hypothetical protein